MIDLMSLHAELLTRPEVRSIEHTNDGLLVIIRSKIEFYDEEMLDRCASRDVEMRVVQKYIDSVEQEHKFIIVANGNYCARVKHDPLGPFCDPYMSMGSYEFYVMNAMRDGDCSRVVDALIGETKSFPVADYILTRRLIEYIENDFLA